jgi:hypothetical protein
MNIPGEAEGNWRWRFQADQLTAEIKARLAELTSVYSRWNGTPPANLDPHYLDGKVEKSAALGNSRAEEKTAAPPAKRSNARKTSWLGDDSARGASAKPRKKNQEKVKAGKGEKEKPG